jgi:hypothetical protein
MSPFKGFADKIVLMSARGLTVRVIQFEASSEIRFTSMKSLSVLCHGERSRRSTV